MQPQSVPLEMSVCECALWQGLIQQRCGLAFSESRLRFLRQSLWERMRLHPTVSYGDYYHYVAFHPAGRAEWQSLLELLLNHETHFFRHLPSFTALAEHILPELLCDPQRGKTLAMWSAGCATGQEVYSLAIAALEQPIPAGVQVKILGSDISQQALEKARHGQYKAHEFRSMPDVYRQRYFRRLPDHGTVLYQVSERVRTLVDFGQVNLCDAASFPPVPLPFAPDKARGFEVIFCQNVLIYFAREDRPDVVQRLCQQLRPGGYLLLGPAEVVGLHLPGMRLVRLADALIYQHLPSPVALGDLSGL